MFTEAVQRPGEVTLNGKPLTVLGKRVIAGQKAPDFRVLTTDLAEVTLADTSGKVRLIAAVPSLDTPVCDLEVQRFNKEALSFSPNVEIYTISMDLPFAQKRWCAAAGVDRVKTFSDHRDASFGLNWGILIKELRLLQRAIFVIDQNDVVRYVEYVKEISDHPNYAAALEAIKALTKG